VLATRGLAWSVVGHAANEDLGAFDGASRCMVCRSGYGSRAVAHRPCDEDAGRHVDEDKDAGESGGGLL